MKNIEGQLVYSHKTVPVVRTQRIGSKDLENMLESFIVEYLEEIVSDS